MLKTYFTPPPKKIVKELSVIIHWAGTALPAELQRSIYLELTSLSGFEPPHIPRSMNNLGVFIVRNAWTQIIFILIVL